MPYDERLVTPMREECVAMGLRELRTPEDVEAILDDSKGTALVFVNSVCGCAAGMARPALRKALVNKWLPRHPGDGLRRPGRRGYSARPGATSPSINPVRPRSPFSVTGCRYTSCTVT